MCSIKCVSFILLFVFVSEAVSSQLDGKHHTRFRYDYDHYVDELGWFKFHRIPATWQDANLMCFLEGAILVSPTNPKLFNAMKAIIWTNQLQATGVYSGIHSTFAKGNYFSVDGVPLSKIPVTWAPEEPNNLDDSEGCLIFMGNGTMADIKCSEPYPFICYKNESNVVLNECGTIDREYKLERTTGSCYKFHRNGQPWSQAYQTCAAEGGYLAIINSGEESRTLRDIFSRYPESTINSVHKGIASIGFHDWGVRGLWRTIHGKSLQDAGFDTFEINQPDNTPPGESCGSIFRSGLLNDLWCQERVPFICEKDPDSLTVDI